MKNTITLIAVLLISISSFAQQGINYKALIKDDLGNVLVSQSVGVQFQIREATANGSAVYTEWHSETTDANGILVLNIGTGTSSDTFTDIDWRNYDHWLNVQIDIMGGTDYTDMSTTQFMAVPYALNVSKYINDLKDGKSEANGSSLYIGLDAGLNDDGTSNKNVGIGLNALYSNTTGYWNSAIGHKALYSNTTGRNNSGNGNEVLYSNTTGAGNTANGYYALHSNTTGNGNTANGYYALFDNDTGRFNSAIGYEALYNITMGEENVAIGYRAGANHTGNGNIFIGSNAGRSTSNTENDKLYIDNTFSNTPLIYGEFNTDLIRINGTLEVAEGINTDVINTDVINTGEINSTITGNANMIPIAYGIVESTGNILSGTGNFTAFLSGNVFVIDVNGTEPLSYSNTVCLITPITTSPRTASTIISDGNGDNDADLNVRIFNSTGAQVLTTFQFVIYKL
ncbi:hypothetical protein [Winogradskyella schleiferi]|uniref:hypothetical protein n=1 Tax=Winogradskyella schleiferi TaxID=2686078 RepID=UPI0015C07760|nr:hypothetical protein [Winogradskyella schleiferi]